MLLYQIFVGISYFFQVLRLLLIIYWIMSLFRPQFALYDLLERFVSPILQPFRALNMKLMSKLRSGVMIDFSIWFALIALSLLNRLSWRLYILLARML